MEAGLSKPLPIIEALPWQSADNDVDMLISSKLTEQSHIISEYIVEDLHEHRVGSALGALSERENETPDAIAVDGKLTGGDELDWTEGATVYMRLCQKVGCKAIRQVSNVLQDPSSMELVMRNRSLTGAHLLPVCTALTVSHNIVSLVLDGNDIGLQGVRYLCWLLKENVILQNLSLKDNRIGSGGADAITSSITMSPSLHRVCLAGNDFQDCDAKSFASLMQKNLVLQDLDLSYNDFGDTAAAIFAPAIASNDYLKTLNLSWNKLRPRGCSLIFKALGENVMLKSLDMAMNGMSSAGCTALGDTLQHNETIGQVDVSNTRILDEHVVKLAKALAKNESLQTLKVGHNPLTAISALALLEAIKVNNSSAMTSLDMSGVPVLQSTMSMAMELKEKKQGFSFLHGEVVPSCSKADSILSRKTDKH